MDSVEVRRLATIEERHWWFAERRYLLDRMIADLPAGQALDVGAAAGGNIGVLARRGWRCVALEYGEAGAEMAMARGLAVVRGDATHMPVRDASIDLVVAFDVLEHIEDHAQALQECARVLRPGGQLRLAVPAGMDLWSSHDDAVGHVRRYDRQGLRSVVEATGFVVDDLRSWMVLLRPVLKLRRRASEGADLDMVPAAVNAALRGVVVLERYLPVTQRPGVSLMLAATRQ